VRFRRERQISAYVPLVGHVKENVVLHDDGSATAMFEVSGLPWETSDPGDVSERHRRLNHTYRNIATDTITILVYQCRGLALPDIYPGGTFRSSFAKTLDENYRRRLFDRSLYDNRIYIAITARPPRYAGEAFGEQVSKRTHKVIEEPPEERIQRLEEVCALLASELARYTPRRLGLVARRHAVFSEIAEALVHAMTGRWRPIGLTTGKLGEAMFSERIIIGREAIEYRLPGESWYAAAFGMRHYPAETWPGMFSNLLAAPYLCTLFQSFRFVQTQTAQDIMKRKRGHMAAANDPAASQAEALRDAADQLGSADWVMGDHSLTLLTFAGSVRSLQDVATAAWSSLANAGATVAREGQALEAALFSLVPGNARLRPRPGYISSINMAALAPLHAFPTGQEKGYWGGPVAMFRTAGGTPYRFHFHVGDVGNTFVCGRTGSGKTTWLAFIAAQAERLGATVVLWDKDRGLKILTHALGGIYLELKNPTGLAPLKALTGKPSDTDFLTALIRGCIQADGGEPLTPEEDRRLHLGLQTVMAMPPAYRGMAEVRAFLGVDPNGAGARLEKWCHGKELGWVIDNPADVISLDAKVLGFDQTFILDNVQARGPVMATLYHYVDRLIDGRRLLFIIDEFWKSLLDPSFRALVNDKLRTLRKLNSPMILATQSPRDALVSSISHMIKDACPSQVYFTNGQATEADFGEQGMGLTAAELEIVRALPEGTGEFLLKQGRFSVRAQLPLHGMDDEIAVLSGRETTTRMFDTILQGEPDPIAAIPAFHRARKEKEVAA
jgi:type IV secretion system protein VirB4